jgi:hypothetical protein
MFCHRTKENLSQKQVTYQERNVTKDPAAIKELQRLGPVPPMRAVHVVCCAVCLYPWRLSRLISAHAEAKLANSARCLPRHRAGRLAHDLYLVAGKEHHQKMMTAMSQLQESITKGQLTSDPAQMKSALKEAQAHLSAMREHMNMCPMMSGDHAMTPSEKK